MNAIHKIIREELDIRINTMCWRMLQLEGFDMSHDECLDIVAPQHHKEILKSVVGYADVTANETYMTVNVPYYIDGYASTKVRLMMRTHEGVEPPLRPRSPRWQGGINPEAEQKVVRWLDHQYKHRRLASTVSYVVQHLSDICDNGQQVRYMWPAIMHLFKGCNEERTIRWMEKYGAHRAVKSIPLVSPELRTVLHETSQWLTQASLLDEIEENTHGQVLAYVGMDMPEFIVLDVALARNSV